MTATKTILNDAPHDEARLALIDPFADQIEWMVRALGHKLPMPLRFGPNVRWHKMQSLRRALEEHVVSHARLPTGSIRLFAGLSPPFEKDNIFDVDLDALAGEVTRACLRCPLPKVYRLPRHNRAQVFHKQIDAMSHCFKAMPGENSWIR